LKVVTELLLWLHNVSVIFCVLLQEGLGEPNVFYALLSKKLSFLYILTK